MDSSSVGEKLLQSMTYFLLSFTPEIFPGFPLFNHFSYRWYVFKDKDKQFFFYRTLYIETLYVENLKKVLRLPLILREFLSVCTLIVFFYRLSNN